MNAGSRNQGHKEGTTGKIERIAKRSLQLEFRSGQEGIMDRN